ncbi:MAG: PTS sugar transporter subunit IIA [Myxococcales bacterium]|nr:PTS sugar transporter subunit IIA [Myxococcales bacterium]
MVDLTAFLSPGDIHLDVSARSKAAVLRRAAVALAGEVDADGVERLLSSREAIASTGVGEGIAIPHASTPHLSQPRIALLRLDGPVEFDAVDDAPIRLVFAVLAPMGAQALHLRLLAKIARLVRSKAVRTALLEASSVAQAFAVLAEQTATPAVLARGEYA